MSELTAGEQNEHTPAPGAETPGVSISERDDGSYNVRVGEKSTEAEALQLEAALGLAQPQMFDGLLHQIVNATATHDGPNEMSFQFAVGFIKDVAPNNAIESALAAQMAATHIAAMDTSRRYMQADSLQRKEVYERALTKLTRTYAVQVETLRKFRNGGKQTVTVQHVNVEEGGQAIVGNVQPGGRGREDN